MHVEKKNRCLNRALDTAGLLYTLTTIFCRQKKMNALKKKNNSLDILQTGYWPEAHHCLAYKGITLSK